MKKEFDNILIKYGEKSKEYIDELVDYFKKESKIVLDFFDLEKLDKPLEIEIWDDIEEFRNFCKGDDKNAYLPDWVCGTVAGTTDEKYKLNILSLEELHKSKSHEKADLDYVKKLLVHEFTHNATRAFLGEKRTSIWLGEGIACSLAKQHGGNIDLSQLSKDSFACEDKFRYELSRVLLDYLIETKGKKYVQDLIKNPKKLCKNSENIYLGMKEFYRNKEKGE